MNKIAWILLISVFVLGCQKKHPVRVYTDPSLKPDAIEKVAVFPFTTMLHHAEDPDGEAPQMMEKFFMPELDTRDDYNFVAPNSVKYALQSSKLNEEMDKFLRNWPTSKKPDMQILTAVRERLGCDAILIPRVDLWQKDEADYQENASSATYVGATITLLDAKSGAILFEASDEDYSESARTETSDRSVIRGGSGTVKSDFGAEMFKAPPFEGVVRKVVNALVSSIPAR